ncbi:hypothetical protein EDB81DRAFT_889383 [Dactylonectria macrodidyma]|uniref:Uncharacterized protein n=1 Tax=Dactylonectria macrodidyma TaxID=307937 RepID=A0A9P9DZ10_9HYPO|nr:hypothetical protein EDB81DRAFT_889383 [Dactylonectria macrodidyma]
MKATGVMAMFLAVMAATSSALPESLPMGVEVVERDGITIVHKVPHQMPPRELESRCANCRGQGQRCTIGDGHCYKESPPLYCT